MTGEARIIPKNLEARSKKKFDYPFFFFAHQVIFVSKPTKTEKLMNFISDDQTWLKIKSTRRGLREIWEDTLI